MLFFKEKENPVAKIVAKKLAPNNENEEILAYNIYKILTQKKYKKIDSYFGNKGDAGIGNSYNVVEDKIIEMRNVRNETLHEFLTLLRTIIENGKSSYNHRELIFLGFLLSEKVWEDNLGWFGGEKTSINYEIFINQQNEYISKVDDKYRFSNEQKLFKEFLNIAKNIDALQSEKNKVWLNLLKLEKYFRQDKTLDNFLNCFNKTLSGFEAYAEWACFEAGFEPRISNFSYPFLYMKYEWNIDYKIPTELNFTWDDQPFNWGFKKCLRQEFKHKLEIGYINVDPREVLIFFIDEMLRNVFVYRTLEVSIGAWIATLKMKEFDNDAKIFIKCLIQNLIDRAAKALGTQNYFFDLSKIEGFDNL